MANPPTPPAQANSTPPTLPAQPAGAGGTPTYGSTNAGTGTSASGAPAVTQAPDLSSDIANKSFVSAASTASSNGKSFQYLHGVIRLIEAVEKGLTFSNIDPAILKQVVSQAGVKPGAEVNGQVGSSQDQVLLNKIKATALKDAKGGLAVFGINAGNATTSTELLRAPLSPGAQNTLKASGYDLTNITSVQSALEKLPTQTAHASASQDQTVTGATIYDTFKSQLADPTFLKNADDQLNHAGVVDTPLDGSNPQATLAAFQKVLGQAPAGKDPYTYMTGKIGEIQAAGINPTAKVSDAYAYVKGLAGQLGFPGVGDNEINAIAAEYPNAGSSNADDVAIKQLVAQAGAQTWTYDHNSPPEQGTYLAAVVDAVTQGLGQYGVLKPGTSSADAVIQKLVTDTLGRGDMSSIYSAKDAAAAASDNYGRTMASGMFPGMSSLLSQGMTTQDIIAPYKQLSEQTLGTVPDLEDSHWASLLTTPDQKMPSLDQFHATIMQDPSFNWQHTQDASTKYASMANSLLSTFGFTGNGPASYSAATPTPGG